MNTKWLSSIAAVLIFVLIRTGHGFKGLTEGQAIDHILVEKNINVLKANIDRRKINGRYPSDHYPVTAKLKLYLSSTSKKHNNRNPKLRNAKSDSIGGLGLIERPFFDNLKLSFA